MEPSTIATERLLLRPMQFDDIDLIHARGIDQEFRRFLPLPDPYTRRDAEMFLAHVLLRDWASHASFTIVLGGLGIGDLNIRVDTAHRMAEMGWGMAREHWGRGYMTEAADAVMRWAIAVYGLDRVHASCDAENIGSYRVMEKLGMRREGFLRQHRLLRGERRDDLVYGILANELAQREER